MLTMARELAGVFWPGWANEWINIGDMAHKIFHMRLKLCDL